MYENQPLAVQVPQEIPQETCSGMPAGWTRAGRVAGAVGLTLVLAACGSGPKSISNPHERDQVGIDASLPDNNGQESPQPESSTEAELPTLKRGDSGMPIYDQQLALYAIGCDVSKPVAAHEAVFGPKTEAAVRTFQNNRKLPVTGELDFTTQIELQRAQEEDAKYCGGKKPKTVSKPSPTATSPSPTTSIRIPDRPTTTKQQPNQKSPDKEAETARPVTPTASPTSSSKPVSPSPTKSPSPTPSVSNSPKTSPSASASRSASPSTSATTCPSPSNFQERLLYLYCQKTNDTQAEPSPSASRAPTPSPSPSVSLSPNPSPAPSPSSSPSPR